MVHGRGTSEKFTALRSKCDISSSCGEFDVSVKTESIKSNVGVEWNRNVTFSISSSAIMSTETRPEHNARSTKFNRIHSNMTEHSFTRFEIAFPTQSNFSLTNNNRFKKSQSAGTIRSKSTLPESGSRHAPNRWASQQSNNPKFCFRPWIQRRLSWMLEERRRNYWQGSSGLLFHYAWKCIQEHTHTYILTKQARWLPSLFLPTISDHIRKRISLILWVASLYFEQSSSSNVEFFKPSHSNQDCVRLVSIMKLEIIYNVSRDEVDAKLSKLFLVLKCLIEMECVWGIKVTINKINLFITPYLLLAYSPAGIFEWKKSTSSINNVNWYYNIILTIEPTTSVH